jgi:hypothetical protein
MKSMKGIKDLVLCPFMFFMLFMVREIRTVTFIGGKEPCVH